MGDMASSSSTTLSDHKNTSLVSHLRNSCVSFAASVQEGFRYVKAFFVGQVKTITARNEKEASEAELESTKMQVEAADAAEDIKKGLKMVKKHLASSEAELESTKMQVEAADAAEDVKKGLK